MIRPQAKLFLTKHMVDNLCKLGQMDRTCRYLATGQSGFVCVKLNPSIKAAIDARKNTFIAKGNNCGGILMLNDEAVSRN